MDRIISIAAIPSSPSPSTDSSSAIFRLYSSGRLAGSSISGASVPRAPISAASVARSASRADSRSFRAGLYIPFSTASRIDAIFRSMPARARSWSPRRFRASA
ncbi:hypothetical protein VH569_35005 [Azospirillum sp. 11R-A]|uniref:hypothetical protein n=1 Tax=Azospirillum sp. 11R-A TaxID=3111634 RepID=UPI003C2097BC